MSLTDGKPNIVEMFTGDRCARPRRIAGPEKECGEMLLRRVVRIPAVISVTVCPRCDALE